MQPSDVPIQIPPGDFASYPSDGQRPYDLFEIYNTTDGGHIAALGSWILLDAYLPAKLRCRKRRKFIETHGATVLKHTVQHHFPTARYVDNHEGAIVEFAITLPAGQMPIPAQLEDRLLTKTHAASFYDQVHTADSTLNRELRHRFQLASVGNEWQKYFSERPV